jgi:hypothetical protein
MRAFYLLVLALGLYLAVLVQLITFAIPRDVFVASVLSRSPAGWNLTLDDDLKRRLDRLDVKAELAVALGKRAAYRRDLYSTAFIEGCGLIVLSAIGLIRETKIRRMGLLLERAAPPAGVTRSDQGVG